jgi:hypothetical protein
MFLQEAVGDAVTAALDRVYGGTHQTDAGELGLRAGADRGRRVGVVKRGELWWVDFGEPAGSEPGWQRPAVVVSSDLFNRSRIATVAPWYVQV